MKQKLVESEERQKRILEQVDHVVKEMSDLYIFAFRKEKIDKKNKIA